ncbi:MAG TPA: PilN domain-containing protein [Burkholderiales bacterium]
MSQQINLYNPIFRKQKKVFSSATMLQAFALIVLVVAVFYFAVALQTPVLEIRSAETSRLLKAELERLKAYGAGDSPAERAKAIAERRKGLEAALSANSQALAAFEAEGGRVEGYAEVLRALARVSVDGVWLTRINFARGKGDVSIVGRATRPELVPTYLERLRAEQALRVRDFSRLEVTRPTETKGAAAAPRAVQFMVSSVRPAAAK